MITIQLETGGGEPGNNSYADVAMYCDYHLIDIAGQDEPAIKAALIRGTRDLDRRNTFKGYISATAQSLSFPRQGITDKEGRSVDGYSIPSAIIQALCELALKHLTGAFSVAQAQVKAKSSSMDGTGGSKTEYFQSLDQSPFAEADLIVSHLIEPVNNSSISIKRWS